MVEISADLPDYLRTSHSIAESKSVRFSRKHLKTPLTQGVSENAPEFFKVSRVPIVTLSSRKELYGSGGDRYLGDLKKYHVNNSKHFEYSDYERSNFDYDSISCRKRIDTSAGRSTLLRKKGEFGRIYQKYLEKGFGISRGEFTVEQTNPKILRDHSAKAETLENILRKNSLRTLHLREKISPCRKPEKIETRPVSLPRKSQKSQKLLKDLEKFESDLPKFVFLKDSRKIYTVKKPI